MKSMGKFVYKRIPTPKGKMAYHHAMKQAIHFVSQGLESMDMIKARIEGIRDEADTKYPKRFFNKREDERSHHHLAVDHALDFINSLEARFITGSSDAAPRGYNGKGIVYDGDELF
jgi:hypothetical protein